MPGDISRRIMLGATGALLSTVALVRASALHGRTPLTLTLKFSDGKSLVFNESNARDIGDYVGPFVRQKCFRQRAGGNGDYRDGFTVFFRPDADGRRQEVVIEYGSEVDFSGMPPKPARGIAAAHCGPYTATIAGGALAQPVTIQVPGHWFAARWRWQSAPRPIVRRYADLVAMRAILPLDGSILYGAVLPRKAVWKGPMDTGGLTTGMGGTADRPDIGPTTDWMAAWLLGHADYEESWRAVAEATGSMPFWVRDEAAGNLVDVLRHPFIAYNDAAGGRYRLPKAPPPSGSTPYFHLDEAHMPEAAFLAWLLTDDPYFLEGAQATALYGIMEANYRRLNETPKLPGLAHTGQTRGWAWSLRDLFDQAGHAPETAPSWLHPRLFWAGLLPDSLAYAKKYLAATTPQCAAFGLIPETGFISTFMINYLVIVMAKAKWTGRFPEWDAVVAYTAKPRMAMSDHTGASGWDARLQAPYNLPVVNARQGVSKLSNGNYTMPATADTPASWKELFDCACKIYSINPATWEPGRLIKPGWIYLPMTRAALAALALAGLPGARERHDWLKTRMDAQFPTISGAVPKWAVAPVSGFAGRTEIRDRRGRQSR